MNSSGGTSIFRRLRAQKWEQFDAWCPSPEQCEQTKVEEKGRGSSIDGRLAVEKLLA